jgi:hypothetical protein
MLEKRVSTERRLVSHFDSAFHLGFSDDEKANYDKTLDIEELGDFSRLAEKPTIFYCDPLKTKWEYLMHGDRPDWWGIFQTHVSRAENFHTELKRDNMGILPSELREVFTPIVVQDIALQINHVANNPEQDCFFTPLGAARLYAQRVIMRAAEKESLGHARMGDVMRKNSG